MGWTIRSRPRKRRCRPLLVTILDTLGAKVPDKMTLVPCMFMRGFKASDPALTGEYTGQLKRQEAKINAWSVHMWMERRAQFGKFSAQPDSRQPRRSGTQSSQESDRKRSGRALRLIRSSARTFPRRCGAFPAQAGMPGAQSIIEKIFDRYSDSTKDAALEPGNSRGRGEQGDGGGRPCCTSPTNMLPAVYNKITDIGGNIVNGDIGANWAGMSPRAPRPGAPESRRDHRWQDQGRDEETEGSSGVVEAGWECLCRAGSR